MSVIEEAYYKGFLGQGGNGHGLWAPLGSGKTYKSNNIELAAKTKKVENEIKQKLVKIYDEVAKYHYSKLGGDW